MKKKTKSITTVVSFILDESGSMESIRDSVITGFNEYVQGLKSQKGEILFSLTKFDSNHINMSYVMEPIDKVEPLDSKTYRPGASTPLYDAVVETIEKLVEKTNDKQAIIVSIMTDGYENSSVMHDQKCLAELIKKLQAKGNWTFIFMGANQDSWKLAKNLGIPKGNVSDWKATHEGTGSVLRSASFGLLTYQDTIGTNEAKMSMDWTPSGLGSKNYFGTDSQDQKTEEVKKK